MKKLLLIDGMSAAYRAFYAIRGLSTSRGQPTNAVFGFIKMLLKMLKEYEPEYVAIATDSKGPTFRHEQYKEYKAQRKPLPADLASQLPLIKEIAEGYRIPWLAAPGYEADDILATMALSAAREGFEVFILTGDKDLFQLVNDKIKVISPHKDGVLFDRKAVQEKLGVPPSRVADVLALMGDSIDNVPGVPGVGKKTAVDLIKTYQNLDSVLEHAGEVKNKRVRENLIRYADQARLSWELVKLNQEVPITWKWKELAREEPDWEKLREIFGALEFRALFQEVSPAGGKKVDYVQLEGADAPSGLAKQIESVKEVALEVKSDGRPTREAGLSALALRGDKGVNIYLSLREAGARKEALSVLKPLLEDGKIKKYLHNFKSISHFLLNEGIELNGVAWDTLLVSYLLNPSQTDHSLETMSWDFLGWVIPPLPLKERKEKNEGEEKVEEGETLCRRVEAIAELRGRLKSELEEKQLESLLSQMELPLARVLVSMERNGIRLDREHLKRMSEELGRELEKLTRSMFDLAGEEFNINSPRQLSRILFEKLELTPQKKTKTGYSTDVSVLQKLASQHELPALLLQYRQLFKLKSTYVDVLPELINPETGRIHTTFHQAVTATGRLSSSSPNLQNIPIRTELGKKVRSAFIPGPEGWVFLSADYSQIDLRVLAHLSGDPLLLDAFKHDRDIHAFTASQIFHVPFEEVTPEMRRRAKTVNFGIIYGMGAYGLSEELGISYGEAESFINAYFERYSGVSAYIEKTIRQARKAGYVTTLFHRRRYLPELDSDQESVRRFGERTAINTPVQGSAADIIKLAMVEIDRRLQKEGRKVRMLLQLHDELLFETLPEELEDLTKLVCKCMEGVVKLKVDLKTDVKSGNNWGELKPIISNQ